MIRSIAIATFTALNITAALAGQVTVAYGDLNLSTAAGRVELDSRLQAAAVQLCSPVLASPDSEATVRFHLSVYRACIGRLSERAKAQVKADHNLTER